MSGRQSTWDAIDQAKRKARATATPPDDDEADDHDDQVGDELAEREGK